MQGISDKTAVVTGAGSGIGRASAQRFAAEGANVVIADVVADTGQETVDLIEDAGGDAVFVEVDVSDPDSVEKMVDTAVETYGSLDFAPNNAGIMTGFAQVTDIEDDQWDRLLDINLKGIWNCMNAELPVMAEEGGAAIVNTASEAGLVGRGGLASYSASTGLSDSRRQLPLSTLAAACVSMPLHPVLQRPTFRRTPMVGALTQRNLSSIPRRWSMFRWIA